MKFCECGCKQLAPIAKMTNRTKGHIAGQPTRFKAGHWARTKEGQKKAGERLGRNHPSWKEKVTYGNLHTWLNRRYPRKGFCIKCGKSPTEYANLSKDYLREIEDWIELCRSCHRTFDGARGESHHGAKLTQANVNYIREEWKKENHPSKLQLATKFNVSRGLIGHIISYRAWKI